MTYNEAAVLLKNLPSEREFEVLRFPIIAPEMDEDILLFLHEKSKNIPEPSVFEFSSNNRFSVIWVHKFGLTVKDFVKE